LEGSAPHSFRKAGSWFSKSSFISPRSIHKLTSYEECMVYSKIKIASKDGNS